jgi:hypothetical protein
VLRALTRSIWPYKACFGFALVSSDVRALGGFMFQISLPLADNTESPGVVVKTINNIMYCKHGGVVVNLPLSSCVMAQVGRRMRPQDTRICVLL